VIIPDYRVDKYEKIDESIWLLTYNSLLSAYDARPVDLNIYRIETLKRFAKAYEQRK
jgi:hypothetical protein